MAAPGPVATATLTTGRGSGNEAEIAADLHETLERIVLNAHRIAVSLNELGVFKNANISVSEWVVLKTLAGRANVQIRELSFASGLSRQRFRKIVSELEGKGLVVTDQSGGEDRRIREISATSRAEQVLSQISSSMQTLFDDDIAHRRRQSLPAAGQWLERIVRVIRRKWLMNRQAERDGRVRTDDRD